MWDIFFIHSSIEGQIPCFYILAIVGNAAIGIGVVIPISHSIAVPLCIYPELEILDFIVPMSSDLFFFEKLPCHLP